VYGNSGIGVRIRLEWVYGNHRRPHTGPEVTAVRLEIRTTRYFRYEQGHWRQYHHHGSIDDQAALAAYQHAVTS